MPLDEVGRDKKDQGGQEIPPRVEEDRRSETARAEGEPGQEEAE